MCCVDIGGGGEMSGLDKADARAGRAVGKKPQIPGVIPQHYPTSV